MSLKLKVLVTIISFSTILQSSFCIDEECVIETTREHGLCKYVSDCLLLIPDMIQVEEYTVCEYQQRKKIICCPFPKKTPDDRNGTSLNMCTGYSARCYNEQQRALITGGEEANPKEFPHMASLAVINGTGYITIICGGSLISDQYVLTSASCAKLMEKQTSESILILGDLDYNSDNDDASPEIYQFNATCHPGYQNDEGSNNVALLKLNRKVQINDYIRPACLPSTFEVHRTDLIITGWGYNYKSGRNVTILQKSVLELLTDNTCRKKHPSNFNHVTNETHLFCASFPGRHICHGDSGGPVQAYHPRYSCMYTIIGISNFEVHHSCGDEDPSIFTRVFPYLDWIEKEVWITSNN